MALYGILGGNIPDRELLNRVVDLVNFHYNSNVVLNTRYLSSNGDTATTNEFSFYQYQNRLTLIAIYLSTSATALTDFPVINSAVDRTGAAVTYTATAGVDEVKTITIEEKTYYLHFLKRKYTTSHTGDVWITFNANSQKDFASDIFQFMAVQHRETASLISNIADGETADFAWLNSITTILNSNLKISYAARTFDSSGGKLGYSGVWDLIHDEYDLDSNVMDAYLTALPSVNQYLVLIDRGEYRLSYHTGSLSYTGTSYAKGYNFTITSSAARRKEVVRRVRSNSRIRRILDIIDITADEDNEERIANTMQHVNFNIKRFNIFVRALGEPLSSHDLYMIFKTLDRVFYLPFDGFLFNVVATGEMTVDNTVLRSINIRCELNAVEEITVGTDIKIPFNIYHP